MKLLKKNKSTSELQIQIVKFLCIQVKKHFWKRSIKKTINCFNKLYNWLWLT